MEKIEFKSQICTTKEQSERLLALGLKRETADMHWCYHSVTATWYVVTHPYDGIGDWLPAWSLHRLVEMMPPSIKDGYHYSLIYDIHRDAIEYICFANGMQRTYNRLLWDTQSTDAFENIIVCFDWLIKEGYFSQDYLEEKNC